jgi:hypothetical protein
VAQDTGSGEDMPAAPERKIPVAAKDTAPTMCKGTLRGEDTGSGEEMRSG